MGYKGEFSAEKKEHAALAFVSKVWATPASMTLYTGLALGLRCPNVLYVYRKRGKGNMFRVRLEFYKDDLVITPYWDIKVIKKGRGKRRVYYCELMNYGVVVRRGDMSIRPIIKL